MHEAQLSADLRGELLAKRGTARAKSIDQPPTGSDRRHVEVPIQGILREERNPKF